MIKPTLLFHSNSELLEGPLFDKINRELYFVSILDHLIYYYNPRSNEILSIRLESPVGCVFLLERKKVLAASKDGFFEIDFNTLKKNFAFQINIDDTVRYNDGIQDAKGRIIVGTMGYPEVLENKGEVFSFHKGEYKTIIRNTTISNGLAFTKDSSILYFIDTPTKKVAKYRYNIESGDVTFDSYVVHFNGKGKPDGMCIDDEGYLWVAEWEGGCISQWDPKTGSKVKTIELPCTNITSCCFDNKKNLYVTTAKSKTKNDVLGGGLFYIELNNA